MALPNIKDLPVATHRLFVDGENWTDRLVDANVQFRADFGSSGMEFNVTGAAEDYHDAPVEFWLGYGVPQPYFKGTIQAPDDDDKLDISACKAFGPFKDMTEQVLGKNETFVGKTLQWVIMECSRRAGSRQGQIVVVNGNKYNVEQGEQFPFDNKIADVLNTLMEKANFVGCDQPGGRREFLPRPRPGSNDTYRSTLSPSDYVEFRVNPTEETRFKKVVVYRNGDNNKPEVYAEREILQTVLFPPKENRWYVVSDFQGNGQDAQEEAYRLGIELRLGMNKFTLSTLFDPDYKVFDGLKVIRVKKGEERMYSCHVDDGFSVAYAPGSPTLMEIAGKAYEIKHERKFISTTEKTVALSPGVITRIPEQEEISVDDETVTVDDDYEV